MQNQDRSNVPDDGENGDCTATVVATSNSQLWGHEVGLSRSWIYVYILTLS